jgi:hypothetical protein
MRTHPPSRFFLWRWASEERLWKAELTFVLSSIEYLVVREFDDEAGMLFFRDWIIFLTGQDAKAIPFHTRDGKFRNLGIVISHTDDKVAFGGYRCPRLGLAFPAGKFSTEGADRGATNASRGKRQTQFEGNKNLPKPCLSTEKPIRKWEKNLPFFFG